MSAIYYTDSQLDEKIAKACREQLRKAYDGEIICVSLKPLDFGDKQIVIDKPRGYGTMFEQILVGLNTASDDTVFFTEHDNFYHPSHFDFTPPDDKFWYDLNWWKIRKDGLAVHWNAVQVSGLVCQKTIAQKYYESRVATFDPENFDRKFEPTTDTKYETWWAEHPSIDIRHDHNLTYNKWKLEHFRKKDTAVNFEQSTIDNIKGWDNNVLRNILN